MVHNFLRDLKKENNKDYISVIRLEHFFTYLVNNKIVGYKESEMEGRHKTSSSMTFKLEESYQLIARCKVLFQGGNCSPKVCSKCVQCRAENRGRMAGEGNSVVVAGSRVGKVCVDRSGSLARICFAHS